ncbi:MAG: hypothetical protein DBX03_00740 [Puniceicoccaceae bacterium]|nr:MAG: hypothetical protein DBX03_00740 [Puniceicoccaceae bacterium]
MKLSLYPNHLEFTPEEQMALDAWMLMRSEESASIGFRCYQMANTVTIGRSQAGLSTHSDRCLDGGLKWVRRPTGGGTVCHGNDLIYALSFPRSHDLYSLKLLDSYQTLHAFFSQVLRHFSLETVLHSERVDDLPRHCFDAPNQYDLLSADSGKKIAGSAIKKSKAGILVQGSICCQLPLEEFFEQSRASMIEYWTLEPEKILLESVRKCCHWLDLCQLYKSDQWNFSR